MLSNLKKLFEVSDLLHDYLEKENFSFDDGGLPIFSKKMFLSEWPDLVVPINHRKDKIVLDKTKTVLCFYAADKFLYPRLENILSEISIYKEYMGVIGFDITITNDMDIEWQKWIFMINQLFMAVLAIHGIKIILNTRSASLHVEECFRNIPKNIMVASGLLGCNKIKDNSNFNYLSKILFLRPNKVVLYGHKDEITENQLELLGFDYKNYKDFHQLSKGRQN